MKKYRVHFSATIKGTQIIEAQNKKEAEEQFSVDSITDFNDDKINAEIDEIEILKGIWCKCGKPGTRDSCPFRSDVHNDSKTLCDCCSDCRHNCAMDI